jgi:glyoxylase-like metal-dependent hydrolase (beta-lactamase superfamily II)
MSDDSPRRAQSHRVALIYPFDEVPGDGVALDVAPGVRWFRIPLGLSLSHINLWAIEDGEGWSIVDCGLFNANAVAVWQQVALHGLEGKPVKAVYVTHMHPDHIGMAGWLVRKFNCPLWMTALEYMTCRVMAGDTGLPAPEESIRFYRGAGWNDQALIKFQERFGSFGKSIDVLPQNYRRLHDGQRLRIGRHEWRIVVGSGHSPEHACLYCAEQKLFISGDQVLPKISSNVSVFPTEPQANPLAHWLDSIEKIKREVPDDVLVLPAHNEPFRGLHARLDHLARGHHAGLDRLRVALATPKRAIDVFGTLFARTITDEPMLLGMATGESLAHLNYLVNSGEATVEADKQGVNWYRMTNG